MRRLRLICILAWLTPLNAAAQAVSPPAPAGPFQLPTVVVTAQKEPADVRTVPVSVTAVGADTLWNTGATRVSDAAIFAPNTYFNEFTARKLSNPRMRGVGSSPANPGVTTYIDGVPQLNANASSVDLLDVEQIEFARGPQSPLFGRNVLGGLVNISSVRPSLSSWSGSAYVPLGNASAREVRGGVSGPLVNGTLGLAASMAYGERDGFTVNDITGRTVDDRSAFSGKAQLLWTPAAAWEARAIVSGERARDGDYALNDLGALRQTPFHTARDFEGFTHRDIVNTTVLARREGGRITFSTTTGFVRWKTDDATDLDYSPLPLVTRENSEEAFQFTQEVRVASAANAPPRLLSDNVALRWQGGVFLFTQDYEQDAVNQFAPFLISPLLGIPVSQTSPQAQLDDVGVGLYGQATATLRDRVDVTAGARFDHENKQGQLSTFFTPAIASPSDVDAEQSFSNVSPQVAVSFRPTADRMLYGAMSRGFKAGGFNPASPPGSEAYDEEHTWNFEGGIKGSWAGRVSTSAAVFFIDWDGLQLNVPNPGVPGQFYISNVGSATSTGVELEVNARVSPIGSGSPPSGSGRNIDIDIFGMFGYTRARFGDDSISSGALVAGNEFPNAPEFTLTFGTQLARALSGSVALYGRAEGVFYGSYFYDDLNTAGQDAYSLANFRAGVRARTVFAEAWVRNAFDTHYIPVAFPYLPFAPSGFVGEMGRPRTFGLRAGVTF